MAGFFVYERSEGGFGWRTHQRPGSGSCAEIRYMNHGSWPQLVSIRVFTGNDFSHLRNDDALGFWLHCRVVLRLRISLIFRVPRTFLSLNHSRLGVRNSHYLCFSFFFFPAAVILAGFDYLQFLGIFPVHRHLPRECPRQNPRSSRP